MTLHREGTATILIALFVFLGINALCFFFTPRIVFYCVLGALTIVLFLVINFFRSPRRRTVTAEGAVIAPADGKVVVIEETFEPEVLKCQCLQVSIFMSVFNVHINWYPVAGKVKYYRHHRGNYMAAWLPKSSTENERSSVVVEQPDGKQILVRQVAGAMARRIVCYAEEERNVKQAEQMGFIKFGSRVDVYLPLGSKIDVKLNDKVTGSQTILGWLK